MSGKTVTIPIETARQALELFRNIEAADAHFQTCQAIPFRQHVRSVYRAANVEAAYRVLAAAVEQADRAPDAPEPDGAETPEVRCARNSAQTTRQAKSPE